MTKRVVQLGVLLALGILMVGAASATVLVSDQGVFGGAAGANDTYRRQFSYNPGIDGSILTIQTYGYGGSSNAPLGRNAAGTVIVAGGFDPIVGLYAGAINGGGALLGSNDDGVCGAGAGATHLGICFDSTMVFNNLTTGLYTVTLSAFSNFPPATESGMFPGGGSFNGRTNAYAIDVVSTPEPMTSMLLGSGLLGLAFFLRRKRA